MCGFAGYIAQSGVSANLKSKIGNMTGVLSHRGPDDRDFFINSQKTLALGFQRLSIQDLSKAGAQPMRSASGRFVLVYNGETYNVRALRRELESAGRGFKGHSDTEVVLAAIEEWGLKPALRKMNGMFALALYDLKDGVVMLARDRLGQKPLYYGTGPDGLYFASELKSIVAGLPSKPQINRDVAALYLRWRYVPDPHCIYRDFHKLLPGCVLRIELESLRFGDPSPYWSLQSVIAGRSEFTGTREYALNVVHETLREAVSDCLIADVPLGTFLSGGVDSSLITALAQSQSDKPLRTFTMGFEDPAYNEAPYAKEVADHLGTDHTHMVLKADDALETVGLLPDIFDEPFGDPSAIPTYHLSAMTKTYMNVALSGDGGDEGFGGYGWYGRAAKIQAVPAALRHMAAPFMRFSPQQKKLASLLKASGPRALYMRLHSYWYSVDEPLLTFAPKPLGTPFDDIDFEGRGTDFERLMAYDSVMFLPGDVLVKVDRLSMAHALEVRCPLLEHELLEFIWSLPPEMRQNKSLLRELLYRHVPQELVDRPKRGFSIPHSAWLRGPLARWAGDLLIEDYTGLLNMKSVQKIWQAHKTGRADYGHLLWSIVQFQAWARRWV